MTYTTAITRRRMLTITGAAAGVSILAPMGLAGKQETQPVAWRGIALGAPAEIRLYTNDQSTAHNALKAGIAELRRLEAIFSLHRPDSALVQLNRSGSLSHPPLDLVRLISMAKAIGKATNGAFDPTIQPLWALYAAHFARSGGLAGPPRAQINEALKLVDASAVTVASDQIAFGREGMALSLNGIAQGYITDRVAGRLRAAGLDHVLIDMGETRALGAHPARRPWRVGIAAPDGNGGVIRELYLIDRSIATSAPMGTPFEPTGRYHHLLDPRTGHCASYYNSVSVVATNATLADALSTAFSIMKWRDIEAAAMEMADISVFAQDGAGDWRVIENS